MHEYLLSVAQKIIDASAPPAIALKYYELKKYYLFKSSPEAKQSSPRFPIFQELPTIKGHLGSEVNRNFSSSFHINGMPMRTQLKINKTSSHILNPDMDIRREQTNKDQYLLGGTHKEVVEDNKWLIEQMQKLIKENNILRKMCEKIR